MKSPSLRFPLSSCVPLLLSRNFRRHFAIRGDGKCRRAHAVAGLTLAAAHSNLIYFQPAIHSDPMSSVLCLHEAAIANFGLLAVSKGKWWLTCFIVSISLQMSEYFKRH